MCVCTIQRQESLRSINVYFDSNSPLGSAAAVGEKKGAFSSPVAFPLKERDGMDFLFFSHSPFSSFSVEL